MDAQTRRAASRGARLLARHEVLDITVTDGRVTGVVTDRGELAGRRRGLLCRHLGPGHRGQGRHDPAAHPAGAPAGLDLLRAGPRGSRRGGRPADPAAPGRRTSTTASGSTPSASATTGTARCRSGAQDIARLDASEVMPSVLEFTQEDFEEAWRQTQLLLPSTRDAKIEEGINGLFSFTTDNMPLIGQSPDVSGFWVAEAVWVTHSAGVGRAVAELLVDGHCSTLRPARVRREPVRAAPALAGVRPHPRLPELRRGLRHPAPAAAGRGPAPAADQPVPPAPAGARRRVPRGVRLGAPQWYAANAGLVDGRDIPTPNDWAARYWSPIVGRRGAGDPRGRRDVRHDGAEAARGDRPGARRRSSAAWSPATWTSPSAR